MNLRTHSGFVFLRYLSYLIFTIYLFVDSAFSYGVDDSCAICLESLTVGEVSQLQYCSHSYHTPCIEQWQNSSNSCPCCREPLKKFFKVFYKSKKRGRIPCALDFTKKNTLVLKFEKRTVEIHFKKIRAIYGSGKELWISAWIRGGIKLEKFKFKNKKTSQQVYQNITTLFSRS